MNTINLRKIEDELAALPGRIAAEMFKLLHGERAAMSNEDAGVAITLSEDACKEAFDVLHRVPETQRDRAWYRTAEIFVKVKRLSPCALVSPDVEGVREEID